MRFSEILVRAFLRTFVIPAGKMKFHLYDLFRVVRRGAITITSHMPTSRYRRTFTKMAYTADITESSFPLCTLRSGKCLVNTLIEN
jgi:hypothetical protein